MARLILDGTDLLADTTRFFHLAQTKLIEQSEKHGKNNQVISKSNRAFIEDSE